MEKSYADITAEINRGIIKLRQSVPDAMAGFSAMAKGALKAGVLSELHKELIALAIGVADHCDGCIGFHAKSLVRLGATREQVMEALAVAVYMGGGPSLMYAAEAVHAYYEFAETATAPHAVLGWINVDEAQALAQRFRVFSIPALPLFRDDAEAQRIADVMSIPQPKRWFVDPSWPVLRDESGRRMPQAWARRAEILQERLSGKANEEALTKFFDAVPKAI